MPKPRVIYWFRTDLRLHDSPALTAALDLKPECLWPVWCWDPHYVYRSRVGPNRWQFLLDCQSDLSASITKLNSKSKLHVIREAPQTLLPKLFKAWKVSHLVFEKDTDAYARDRDDEVKKLAKDAGVEVIVKSGRTLYDADELVKNNNGKPTMSQSQVIAAGKKIGKIPRPFPTPKSLPDPGETELDFERSQPEPEYDLNASQRESKDKAYEQLAGPNGDFAVPTMDEIGVKKATTPHRGGETNALKSLDKIIKDKHYTATFEKPKTAPTDFDPQSTTLLSPHLHFGSLGIREFYWRVQDVVDDYKGASQPPASLTGQLLFRDMYFGAQAKLGYFMSQTIGNDQVRFVPWHLRSKVDKKTRMRTGGYVVDDEQAEEWFVRWKEGRTGFPWIDAAMRQLRAEGWIHHLARHAVACFLTRGGCYIDWERGADVFEEFLIDHEVACNAGNWQWLSCTAFFAQFYRCYSPISFPQKTDKNGDYVRHYVPELKDYPAKYIYEPWKAPIADQKKWKCRVTGDGTQKEADGIKTYPKAMFDFSERRRICLDGMKGAYDRKLYGTSKQVLDETWPGEFPNDAEGPTEGEKGDDAMVVDSEGESRKPVKHEHSMETDYGTDADEGDEEGDGKIIGKRKRKDGEDGPRKAQK